MKGRRQTQSGHAMLELSVTAGIVLAFIGWTFQFGYAFYPKINDTHALGRSLMAAAPPGG